jgi:hypothetical protein
MVAETFDKIVCISRYLPPAWLADADGKESREFSSVNHPRFEQFRNLHKEIESAVLDLQKSITIAYVIFCILLSIQN